MGIDKIIQVTITRESTPIQRESFGIPLLLGAHKVFDERAKVYSTLDEISGDGFLVSSNEYIASEKLFSQNPRVEEVVIGRRDADTIVVTVENAVDSIDYSTTINGTPFIYDSGVTPTVITIATGLVGVINLGAEPVTATDNLDGTYDLVADVAGTAYTVALDTDQAITTYTLDNAIDDDITAIKNFNNDWYMIIELLQDSSELLELAAWVETEAKLLGTTSDDNNIVDQDSVTDTTSIAALLKSGEYDRTYVAYWNADYLKPADLGTNKYLDAAWDGKQLPKDPGSSNWAHKNLNAFQALTLNDTQIKNAIDKNANVYVIAGADGRTRYGTMAGGEYIDIMRGVDWLTARLQEDVFILLATTEKVPYTDAGIAMAEGVVKKVLEEGVAEEFLEPNYIVTVPKIENVDPVDRANRHLKNITFSSVPQGAINTVAIQGTVSVF